MALVGVSKKSFISSPNWSSMNICMNIFCWSTIQEGLPPWEGSIIITFVLVNFSRFTYIILENIVGSCLNISPHLASFPIPTPPSLFECITNAGSIWPCAVLLPLSCPASPLPVMILQLWREVSSCQHQSFLYQKTCRYQGPMCWCTNKPLKTVGSWNH